LTKAQRILGQFNAAFRDLQGVLAGFNPADFDKKPAPNDWQMRNVLAHMARAQLTFYVLADYGLRMRPDEPLPEGFPLTEVIKTFGSLDDFSRVSNEEGLPEMMALFSDSHQRTLERFVGVADDELDKPGPVWWEGEALPIHYRLGRMEAHMRQHTIQAVKTRTAVSGPLSEAVQLLRLLYNALAAVEAAVLGAPELGQADIPTLAEKIVERANAAGKVYRQTRGLIEAVKKGEKAKIETILALNPKLVNATDQQGTPLLMAALYHGQRETAVLLQEAGADVHIFEAAALGDFETVKAEGTEWPEDLQAFGRDGFTALQLACYFGQAEVATWLVEQGADVEAVARNEQKICPIHAATANGNLELIQMLLDNGAGVNAAQQGGIIPLHSAAHHGNLPLAELLLKYGADPTIETAEGKNSADMAKEAGHEAVYLLLSTQG
jgi:ankyrin repeat protein